MDMDMTNYLEGKTTSKKILSCRLNLSKRAMLEALAHDKLCIHGRYYKVPEASLLHYIMNKHFGELNLDLEEID